jgi:hypothetical protein
MSAVDGARNCATSRCISFGAWCKAHTSIKTRKSSDGLNDDSGGGRTLPDLALKVGTMAPNDGTRD